jgi:hypothetical protein
MRIREKKNEKSFENHVFGMRDTRYLEIVVPVCRYSGLKGPASARYNVISTQEMRVLIIEQEEYRNDACTLGTDNKPDESAASNGPPV